MSMEWTDEELAEFDRLTSLSSSSHQMHRIESRIELPKFIDKHGMDKCNAMYAHLMQADREAKKVQP